MAIYHRMATALAWRMRCGNANKNTFHTFMDSWQHERNTWNKHSRINSFFLRSPIALLLPTPPPLTLEFLRCIVATVLLNFSWHYLIVHVCNMSFCVILSLNETIFPSLFSKRGDIMLFGNLFTLLAIFTMHSIFVLCSTAQMNVLSEFACIPK